MPTNVDDANALFGIVAWILTGVTIMAIGTFFTWNPRWWAYLRGVLFLPNQDITVVLLLVFGGFEGWGFWQHWARLNMNHGIWIGIFFFVSMISISLYWAMLMISPVWFVPAATSVIALIFSCLYVGWAFFWYSHTLTGIMGIVAVVVAFLEFVYAITLFSTKDVYAKYEEIKEKIVPVEAKYHHFSLFKKKDNYTVINADNSKPVEDGSAVPSQYNTASAIGGYIVHVDASGLPPGYN